MRKHGLLPILLAFVCSASAVSAVGAQNVISDPGKEAAILMDGGSLPGTFDIRDEGKSPVIRSQGNNGTCWAITAASALEAALMPQAKEPFSPDHLIYNNSFEVQKDEGGDFKMIMAYLSAWQGPVYEKDDPYGDGETDPSLQPAVHVQEMRMYTNASAQELKAAIAAYGGLQTSLYMERTMAAGDTQYYKEETSAFYCPQEHEPTHDVLILGWDDDYPRENFAQTPAADGAWICQNTWGEDFGEKGIFYVSYEDAAAAKRALAYARVEEADNYDRIYQTDVFGWQGAAGYKGQDTCYMANVYTADTDQTIEAAGFYSVGTDTDYEVFLVHDFQGTDSMTSMEKVGEGHIDAKGYFTVPVSGDTQLRAGERFALILKIRSAGHEKVAALEMAKDKYTQNIVLEGKEGYISKDGYNWENAEEIYRANVCLKAFTDNV